MKTDRFPFQCLSLFSDDLHKSTAGALTRWRVCPIAKVERGRRAGRPAASPAREEHVKEHKDVKWLQKSESDTRPLRMPQHRGHVGSANRSFVPQHTRPHRSAACVTDPAQNRTDRQFGRHCPACGQEVSVQE